MNFAAWQALSPAGAAQEYLRRVALLSPAQRRAVLVAVPTEAELIRRFEAAVPGLSLSGVPVLLKDLFDLGGEPTNAGSTFLAEVRLPRPVGHDGALGRDLRRAGAVIVGKTQMVEFAYGLTGENAHYGDCVHPRFPDRTSGGSSSGSAAAVAAGLVPFAAGSDTGGSIRIPAAFCGIYGLRLAPYQHWIEDAVPLAVPFDTAGWFTGTAEDMRLSLDGLLPFIERAKGARDVPSEERVPAQGCYLEMPHVDREVARACAAAAERLACLPGHLEKHTLHKAFADAPLAYQVIGSLAAWEAHQPWFASHRDRYSPMVRDRLERALQWKPGQIREAREARDRIMRTWDEYFQEYDYLLMPAAPFPALKQSELTPANRQRILDLTTPASLGGLPALTLPVSLGPQHPGLTCGLQLIVKEAHDPFLRVALRNWENHPA